MRSDTIADVKAMKGEFGMKDSEAIDWRLVLFRPLGLLALTVPLLAALAQVSTHVPQPAPPRSWQEPLQSAEQALAQGHLDDAIRAEREAYRAALTSRQWPGMIEVGDLRLRMHQLMTTGTEVGQARAREAYLIALVRACRDEDLGGVLRAVESFAKLDEDAVATSGASRPLPSASPRAWDACESSRPRPPR